MELMNTDQWFAFSKLVNPAFELSADMKRAADLGVNTKWLDYFFNEAAPVWSADLSISGATAKTDYYFSFGAFD